MHMTRCVGVFVVAVLALAESFVVPYSRGSLLGCGRPVGSRLYTFYKDWRDKQERKLVGGDADDFSVLSGRRKAPKGAPAKSKSTKSKSTSTSRAAAAADLEDFGNRYYRRMAKKRGDSGAAEGDGQD